MKIISECALNVLKGNVKLSDFKKRKLRKFGRQLRTVVDKHVPLARKMKLIIQRGGFLVPLLLPTHLFTIILRIPNMLRKMYFVSPDYVSHQPPTPSPQQPKDAVPMSRTKKSKQQWQRVPKQKKRHPYDNWVTLKRKIEEGDVTRKTLIEKIAAFLQSVLPYGSTPTRQSMPLPITLDVQTGLKAEVSDTASSSLPFLSRAHESICIANKTVFINGL